MKQKPEQLHFQLPTQECWSHSWRQPSLQFMHSSQHDGQRFCNVLPRPQGRGRADLLKWLFKRKSSTWNVDVAKEHAEFHAVKRVMPQDRPQANIDPKTPKPQTSECL